MTPHDIWITAKDASASLDASRQQLHAMREAGKIRDRRIGTSFEYLLSSLPPAAQEKYWSMRDPATSARKLTDAEIYASAPMHARRKADKYLRIINASQSLSGAALHAFIAQWNAANQADKTSYSRLVTSRSDYRQNGISALLGKWGKRSAATKVPDDLFSYFKSLYLSDGRPSVLSCWKITLGHAINIGLSKDDIPSASAFERRLKKEIPQSSIYTAREGAAAANRKYGFFIRRNTDDILAGEIWISDHAQVDVACQYDDHGRTKIGYPWITAWRDFKSGMWTGWDLHMEGPNSDFIFMSFHRGGSKYGLPSGLYLDNGKDYRCKDFAGGRRIHRLDIDEGKTTALTAALGINVTYAWPYNAQSKSIERDFNRQKEWFSKHATGYRGGDVVERPEAHNETIKKSSIMTIDEFRKQLDFFITDIAMQTAITSGPRIGKTPLQCWNEEYPRAVEQGKVRHISKQALMLFCTRTSGIISIGRIGCRDSQLGIDYYAEWMEGQKGRKVYLRRDPVDMREAWVFDAQTHDYIGNATHLPEISAMASDPISRQALKERISVKRNATKLMHALSKPDSEIPFQQKMACLAAAERAINELEGRPTVPVSVNTPIHLTCMDNVYAQREADLKEGTNDYSMMAAGNGYVPSPKNTLKIFDLQTTDDPQP